MEANISERDFRALVDRVFAELGFTSPDREHRGLTASEVTVLVNSIKVELERVGVQPGQLRGLLSHTLTGLLHSRMSTEQAEAVARAVADGFGYGMQINRASRDQRYVFTARQLS